MQNEGLVSVIVPVYKVESLLERCLNSIVKQTYSDLEIILVDDGSPDSCGDLCDRWAAVDKRIRVIHKTNGGLGFARNSGLDIATGEYVVFIDSDDFIKEKYVELLINQMIHCNADLVVGGFIRKRSNGVEIENPVTNSICVVEQPEIVGKILLPVIGAEPTFQQDVEREMCVWRNMYRKSIIDDLSLRFVSEREYVSEDIFFNMIYFMNTQRAVLIPECIYYYWDNGTSLTNTYRADRFEKYCKMFVRQEEILKEHQLYERAKLRLYRTFIMKVKKCIALLASANISFSKKRTECMAILENPLLNCVVQEYSNSNTFSTKQAFVLHCMKRKKSCMLLLFYMLVNTRKH